MASIIAVNVPSVPMFSMFPNVSGWINTKWGTSDNNRRAKYYELAATGKKQLAVETDTWRKLTAAVTQILKNA